MAALAKLETAARVRDVVKKVAARVVDVEVSTPLVGRVTAVDLVHLKAMVWFAGDPNPIQVSLFSSVIPGQSEAGFPTDQPSNGLVGYGSIVACQTLNGTLYVTQVLTGGQFSFDFDVLNEGMISQIYYDEFQGGVQPLNGLKASGEMILQLPSISNGLACEFGPFINTYDGGEGAGPMWVEIDVYEQLEGAAKTYRFTTWLNDDASSVIVSAPYYDHWMRVIPEHSHGNRGVSQRGSEWHLDMSTKQTSYGTTPQGLAKTEVWLRITADSLTNAFVQPFVRIRSPWLHKARAVDGSEKFVAALVTNPLNTKGFIGFHNSNGSGVSDIDTYKYRDTFNRTTAAGTLGLMSDYLSNYTLTGTAANFSCAGFGAVLLLATLNSYREAEPSNTTSNGLDQDIWAVVSAEQVSTGAPVYAELRGRKTGSTTFYFVRASFNTGGTVDITINKDVSGTVTTLATQNAAIAYTANQQLHLRFQIKGGKLRAKIWDPINSPPKKWTAVVQSDTAITTTGTWSFAALANTGNTNSNPRVDVFNLEVANSFTAVRNDGKWRTGPWRDGPLRLGYDLQRTMQVEGAFTWDGSNISWTGEIFLGGVGANRHGLVQARHYITCPFSTNYQFPVYGGYSVNSVTSTATGIPLALGQTLYCAIPPGEWEQDLQSFLFVVDENHIINFDDSNRLWQYSLPEWAVMIARRAPDYPDGSNLLGTMPIKLGTGDWLDNWHNVGTGSEPAFNTNWSNTGGILRSTGFRKLDPDHVELKGGASFSSTGVGPQTIFTLPVGYRPLGGAAAYAVTNNPANNAQAALRSILISTSGTVSVTCYGASAINPGPIAFDGIQFSISG